MITRDNVYFDDFIDRDVLDFEIAIIILLIKPLSTLMIK